MFGTAPIEKTVRHRVELLDEIESTTEKLSNDLSQETVDLLKRKIAELSETNKLLQQKKEEYKVKKKCFKCTRFNGLRLLLGTMFIASIGLFIARMTLTYSSSNSGSPTNCTGTDSNNNSVIISDTLEALLIVFGALGIVHEEWLSKEDNDLLALNEATIIEKFGEESYQRFLEALQQLKINQSQEQVKDCIQSLDEISDSKISHSLTKQKLIPKLLEILPENDEIVIKFNQMKEDGRRIHVEITAIEPDRFDGEKHPFTAVSHPELSPIHRFQQKWEDLESALGTTFDVLECRDTIYKKNGTVKELHTMIPISIEEEFDQGMIEI